MTKLVILCGGKGTRLKEETEYKPKPMVQVGQKPILWHIMKLYSYYKIYDFILCLGYKGEIIKEYFNNYPLRSGDFIVDIGSQEKQYLTDSTDELNWKVTLADTSLNSMTGHRINQIKKYIGNDDYFLATYGDAVSDIDINELIYFHKKTGKIATLTGVKPESKYGQLELNDNLITKFNEKPKSDTYINGGYFVFQKEIFDFLEDDVNCTLESKPLETLAKSGELAIFKHDGFWKCMDTYRDYENLNKMHDENNNPWQVWNKSFIK